MSHSSGYFSRQLVLDGFGRRGQRALAGSAALVVGLGGTGSVAAMNLALAGVGSLLLVDRDEVSIENLHRQPFYTLADVGRSKAEVAAAFLNSRVPGLRVRYRAENLDAQSAPELARGADLAMDCLDNLRSRRALNLACVERGIPLVHTGSLGWDGSIAVFSPPGTPCLECLFPPGADGRLPSCEEVGTLGAVTSAVGAMGALEAIKLLATGESPLNGRILFYDARRALTRVGTLKRRKDCSACGTGVARKEERRIIELCGGQEYYVARAFSPRSFAQIPERIGGDAERMGDSVIRVTRNGMNLSFFKHGGLLVKGASSAEDARRILQSLAL